MNTCMPQTRSRQAGVALIEVLVAAMLIAFGLLGLVSLQSRATQFSVGAEDRTRAALLANELASEMWGNGSTAMDAATLAAWQGRIADTARMGLPNGNVTLTNLAPNIVRITVEWTPPKASWEPKNQYMTDVVIPPR
ncbi:MAG: type IV pilus modification protein PilV [Roseateles asaccharophilus]|uniref:type IV pilus modification protein PilV n=1 Tax=Roseateles asaccharophilus TaxID=582607 RepID=UPI00391AFC7D